MIRIRPFGEADLPVIQNISPDMAEELRNFPNVLLRTAVVAEEASGGRKGGALKLLGAAYLTAAPSFLHPEFGDGRCFLRANFQALPGTEQEIEVSELLLRSLQKSLRKLQEKDPSHRIILQLFSDARKLAYMEFLMDCGFFPRYLMQVMERELEGPFEGFPLQGSLDFGESLQASGKLSSDRTDEAALSLTLHTDPDEHAYFEKHSAAFSEAFGGMPESTEELSYQMRHGAKVWAVMDGEKLAAAVTAIPADSETVMTEKVFCRKEYRRRGITEAMLRTVLRNLRDEGYKKARLTLFSDNLPAWNLYRKLGYELSENIIEFHYEVNPVLRGY